MEYIRFEKMMEKFKKQTKNTRHDLEKWEKRKHGIKDKPRKKEEKDNGSY